MSSVNDGEVALLAERLKNQFMDEAKEIASEVTDEAKEFFADVGQQYAKAYWKKKFGNDQDKAEADEIMEALDIAMGSQVASLGLQFVRNGEHILLGMLKSAGKTLLTIALTSL